MRHRLSFTLFPLLSILVGTLGVCAFVALLLKLLGEPVSAGNAVSNIRVEWEGAPAYVRSILLECGAEGVRLHDGASGTSRLYASEHLLREVSIVRNLRDRAAGQAGTQLNREQEWLFFKAVLERDPRLKNSLSLALHRIEMSNLRDSTRTRRQEQHPILLVSPGGLDNYGLAEGILSSTTRFAVTVEPIPAAWRFAAARPNEQVHKSTHRTLPSLANHATKSIP
jgi:hypothetical protein